MGLLQQSQHKHVAACWASGFVKKGFVVPQEQIKDGRMDKAFLWLSLFTSYSKLA